jgi:hypothetical protein
MVGLRGSSGAANLPNAQTGTGGPGESRVLVLFSDGSEVTGDSVNSGTSGESGQIKLDNSGSGSGGFSSPGSAFGSNSGPGSGFRFWFWS